MPKIEINGKVIFAEKDELLSDILIKEGFAAEHPCGGMGRCGKCIVNVDGKDELSCRYKITKDIVVTLPEKGEIQSVSGAKLSHQICENMCLALDIGTTTLALAFVCLDDGSISDIKKCTNPQRRFGADIMTRIDYCSKNGVKKLQNVLIDSINKLIAEIEAVGIDTMYVSGNATMLHTFFGIDPSSIGVSPYTPAFVEQKEMSAFSLGINRIKRVVSLPSVGAFVGADIVAGMNYIKKPKNGKHSLLIDLGTNAEIVLFSDESSFCTAAAAGPCFEGANISCGMSALSGAVYAYGKNGAKTIDDEPAKGICGTGLIDVIAHLLKTGIMDETGYLECETFDICPDVTLTQEDIRQFQLAKSAINSAISTLMGIRSVNFDDIETVYISGGFSAEINIENAVTVGLLPKELAGKCMSVNNSSLLGTVKFAFEKNDLSQLVNGATYVDLSSSPLFSDLFIKNMLF